MRGLFADDILKLEKFLVDDNDIAIGIEIHSGIRRCGNEYSEPKTIRKISLEELSDGELIPMGDTVLCALIKDNLYTKELWWQKWRVWHTKGSILVQDNSQSAEGEIYTRVVILLKEEASAEKKILVKDNKRVIGVEIIRGVMGVGGSNHSGFRENSYKTYTLEELSTCDHIWVEGASIFALVNDELHLRYTDENGNKQEYTLNDTNREYFRWGRGIAYDTVSAAQIVLLFEEDERKE